MRAFLLLAAALGVLPACGGNVILDTSTSAGGKGGAGGASTSGLGGFGGGTTSEIVSTVSTTTVSSTSVATTDATASVSSTFASSSSFQTTDFAASSSTGGDPCSTGADCTQCPDKQSCLKCDEMFHPAGVADYQSVAQCILCQACFTTCQNEAGPGFCQGQPPTSPCDVAQPFQACGTCQKCSVMPGSLCTTQYDTCMANPDCLALAQAASNCH